MKLATCIACVLLCLSSYDGHFAVGNHRQDQAAPTALLRTHGLKINVDDMERAVAFYCGKLGFEIADRSGHPRRVELKSGDRHRLILNRVPKLSSPAPTDTQFAFTLQVNDLDQTIARMTALGVEFAESERRKEGVGYAISIRDPFGRRISLMHQTIVRVAPFKEPKLYNFGFLIPDMAAGREFYSNKLGFVVRSEKYLPLDLPLGHTDNTFAFMLHYRPGVRALKHAAPHSTPFNTLILETYDLQAAVKELTARGVKILDAQPRRSASGRFIRVEDSFGNVSELLEVAR